MDTERLTKALEGMPIGIDIADPKRIKLLDKNARFMRHETFKNLVANVQRDGALESVPYCIKTTEEGYDWLVLSGNHRVKAAVAAGIQEILIMFPKRELSKQEALAKQLSHNAIAGEDDLVILKELWQQLDEVEMKYYAGFDDKLLGELSKISLEPLAEVKMDFRSVTFLFLPEEVERLDAAFKKATELLPADDTRVMRMRDFDRLLEATKKVGDAYGIKNVATAMGIVLDIFDKYAEAELPTRPDDKILEKA